MPLFNPFLISPLADPPAPDPADATAILDFTNSELSGIDPLLSSLDQSQAGAASALGSGSDALDAVGAVLDEGDTVFQVLSDDIDTVDFTLEIATSAAAAADATAADSDIGNVLTFLGP